MFCVTYPPMTKSSSVTLNRKTKIHWIFRKKKPFESPVRIAPSPSPSPSPISIPTLSLPGTEREVEDIQRELREQANSMLLCPLSPCILIVSPSLPSFLSSAEMLCEMLPRSGSYVMSLAHSDAIRSQISSLFQTLCQTHLIAANAQSKFQNVYKTTRNMIVGSPSPLTLPHHQHQLAGSNGKTSKPRTAKAAIARSIAESQHCHNPNRMERRCLCHHHHHHHHT